MILFRIISISNQREIDIKVYNPKNVYYQVFFFNLAYVLAMLKKRLNETFLLRSQNIRFL